MQKRKSAFPMIALAVITLILSSYGLFALAHDYGAVPFPLALVAVAGFDLFAVAAGAHAMKVARDGDSAGVWNLAVIGTACLSAGLQYAHTQLAGQPVAVGIMMAMFPVATVSLFEGTLRRAHRLQGRRSGRVAEPRASFEIMHWFVYPRATWRAFKLGVADRTLGADGAFKLGLIDTAPPDDSYAPPARVDIELDYSQAIPGYRRVVAGQTVRQLAGSSAGQSLDAPPDAPEVRSITEIVRESLQINGPDESARAAIVADVLAERPEADEKTIRRTIRRLSALRSA